MKTLNLAKKLHKKKTILSIGIFDGVHLGHKRVLSVLIRQARKEKRKAAVLTFSPHPLSVLYPDRTPPLLLSLRHRLKMLCAAGIDTTYVLKFDKHFAARSAESFTKNILMKKLNVARVIVGEDFCLGHHREGNINVLRGLFRSYNIGLRVVKNRKINRKLISSTLIRNYITSGQLDMAVTLLGRDVSVLGTVVHGDKRGRILGFPTANLDLHHEAVPAAGVYAVKVKSDEGLSKGILNIGFRPTFKKKNKERTVEVHVFGLKENIYGKELEVIFVKKIRAEKHFKNKEHLKAQIAQDIIAAKKILR